MTEQIKWKKSGFYFLQNGTWFLVPFQGTEAAVREYLRVSAIEFTELLHFEQKPNMVASSARPVIPKLKLWDTPWKYPGTTNEGIDVDQRLVMVAPTREIAAEGAYAYDDEYPCNPNSLEERVKYFNSKKIKEMTSTGKMPSITNTLRFCYYNAEQQKWVTPVEIVTGYL